MDVLFGKLATKLYCWCPCQQFVMDAWFPWADKEQQQQKNSILELTCWLIRIDAF